MAEGKSLPVILNQHVYESNSAGSALLGPNQAVRLQSAQWSRHLRGVIVLTRYAPGRRLGRAIR